MSDKTRVAVAMSGGVDSSVAAALLVEQGYEVIGMMLRLWSEPGAEAYNRCCTPEAMALARRVAAKLGIPFYAVDVRERFRQEIVQFFIDGYAQGITPNPCLNCNRQIRFGFLRQHALAAGADFLATGHYVRLRRRDSGRISLLKGLDEHKDQSYVLSVLSQEQLNQALFPVGEFTKPEVRELARKFDLPVAERSDSQDLCFLAGGDYRDFLLRSAPQLAADGMIVDRQGNALGAHQGLANYTIGQRKGLGISSPEPLYVLEKDISKNILVVGRGSELGSRALVAGQVNWIEEIGQSSPLRAEIKIRYKAKPAWGTVTPLPEDSALVQFDHDLRDITPGQACVFYAGEIVLGGGVIQRVVSETEKEQL